MRIENLVPLSERTKDEQRVIATAGGIASGKARRRKGDLKKAMQTLLSAELDVEGTAMTGAEHLAIRLFQLAMEGNVKAFEVVRDTAGQKPVREVTVEAAVMEQRIDVSKLTDAQLDKILQSG